MYENNYFVVCRKCGTMRYFKKTPNHYRVILETKLCIGCNESDKDKSIALIDKYNVRIDL